MGRRGEGEESEGRESDTHFVRPVSCAAVIYVIRVEGRHSKHSDDTTTLLKILANVVFYTDTLRRTQEP